MTEKKKTAAGAIKVPDEAMLAINNIQQQMRQLEGHFGSYLTGLKQGLGVPADWQLDMQKRLFVPPQENKKQ